MLCRAIVIILLAFVAQAGTAELAAAHYISAQESMEKLIDNLVDRAMIAWPVHPRILDDSTMFRTSALERFPRPTFIGPRSLFQQARAALSSAHSLPSHVPHRRAASVPPRGLQSRREVRFSRLLPRHSDLKALASQPLTTVKTIIAKYEQGLDNMYEKSFRIKCPFFRRRAFDTIEAMKRILLFIAARHKSTPLFPNPRVTSPLVKSRHLPLQDVAAAIHNDWMGRGNGKGYYITGALSEQIYDEACIFDGPDPDMPVKGLRKYLLSASQLFDKRKSRADLTRPIEYDIAKGTIIAYWRLQGIINLPWHPQVKPWTGSTTYYVDPEGGLVVQHLEDWDISVPDAFISTLFPGLNFGASAAEPVDRLVIDEPRPVGSKEHDYD